MPQNEFRLLPWEWNPQRPTFAQYETDPIIKGESKCCLFKTHHHRVFFQMPDDTKERTFAVTTPLPPNLGESQCEQFVRDEIAKGNVGLLRRGVATLHADERTAVAVIWNADDSGVLSEWISPHWISFAPQTAQQKRGASVWDEDWYPLDAGRLAHRLRDRILDTPFEVPLHENIPLDWHGSSCQEVEQLVLALSTVFSQFEVFFHTPASVLMHQRTRFGHDWPSMWIQQLIKLLPTQSQQWVRRPEFPPQTRRGWKLEVGGSLNVECSSSQSQHERLEALLFLRDWLRTRVAPDEIKAYLPDDLA